MSQENVEIVRSLVEAFRRRDNETANVLLASDVEWDGTRLTVPDFAGVYRGPEGTREFWGAWLSTWKDLVFEYELRDAGDDILCLIRDQRQWGRRSGVETEIQDYGWLYTIREGRVVRGCFYPDHESALEAAGLSE
jgi:ketosteroid isomerase-like protein